MQNIYHTISTTVFAVHPEFVTFLPHKYLSWVTFSTALSLAFLKIFLPPEKRTNDTWKWTLEEADSLLKTINLFPVQPLVFTPRNTNQWQWKKKARMFLDLSPISKMVMFHCQAFWDGVYPWKFQGHTQNGHTNEAGIHLLRSPSSPESFPIQALPFGRLTRKKVAKDVRLIPMAKMSKSLHPKRGIATIGTLSPMWVCPCPMM